MGPGFAAGIGRGLVQLLILALVAVFLLGVAAAIGLPHVWHWLKPLIHGATA